MIPLMAFMSLALIVAYIAKPRRMTLLRVFGMLGIFIGCIFAYSHRGSHENVGVYGVILAVIGFFCYFERDKKVD